MVVDSMAPRGRKNSRVVSVEEKRNDRGIFDKKYSRAGSVGLQRPWQRRGVIDGLDRNRHGGSWIVQVGVSLGPFCAEECLKSGNPLKVMYVANNDDEVKTLLGR